MTRDDPDPAAIAAESREARRAMAPLEARMDAGEHGAGFIVRYCDAAMRPIDAAEAIGEARASGAIDR